MSNTEVAACDGVGIGSAPEAIAAILARYPDAGRDALIPLLQDVQEVQGYLSRESIRVISRHLRLPTSKIYGVATFYNQFRFQPQGKYHVQVCRGTACHVKDSVPILEAIRKRLGLEGKHTTTADMQFTVETIR